LEKYARDPQIILKCLLNLFWKLFVGVCLEKAQNKKINFVVKISKAYLPNMP